MQTRVTIMDYSFLRKIFVLLCEAPPGLWWFVVLSGFLVFSVWWGRKKHWVYRLEAARHLSRLKGEPPEHQMTLLRQVNPFVFEEIILTAIKRRGCKIVRNKRYTGDGGVDGRCYLNGKEYLIQAKCYSTHINPAHVKDFARICRYRKKRGLFIHTGRTGAKSKSIANAEGIEIISGERLLKMLFYK